VHTPSRAAQTRRRLTAATARATLAAVFDTTIYDRFAVIAPHIAPGMAVLDLGCVDARPARRSGQTSAHAPDLLFRRLVAANPETVGVDHDAEGVAALQRAGYHAVCADVHTLDLGRQFDTIIAGELIEHLENPGQFLAAARRHLKPGGKLILTTPNPFYALQTWHIWRRGRPRCNEGHVVWFDPVTLTALLCRSGFEPIEGYWVQPHRRWVKAWKRLFRRYFSHSFLIIATT
jgi:2-polyprenyl-3-methyl-5-hydroxy-6-metoxy-1,4-benzoquinol methylase